jgi:hypothetical protein
MLLLQYQIPSNSNKSGTEEEAYTRYLSITCSFHVLRAKNV